MIWIVVVRLQGVVCWICIVYTWLRWSEERGRRIIILNRFFVHLISRATIVHASHGYRSLFSSNTLLIQNWFFSSFLQSRFCLNLITVLLQLASSFFFNYFNHSKWVQAFTLQIIFKLNFCRCWLWTFAFVFFFASAKLKRGILCMF